MSLFVIHLRWDDAAPGQLAGLQQALPPVGFAADGPCLHRRTWLSGDRVLGVEVWTGDEATRRYLDELPPTSRTAGLSPPTVVVLVFPDLYRSVLPMIVGTPEADTAVPAGWSSRPSTAR